MHRHLVREDERQTQRRLIDAMTGVCYLLIAKKVGQAAALKKVERLYGVVLKERNIEAPWWCLDAWHDRRRERDGDPTKLRYADALRWQPHR